LVHEPSASKKTNSSSSESISTSAVNTTTVTDTEEFRAPASECYQTFTDPQRITAFTRAAPKLFEGAKKGGKFELFGGNVSGEYLELVEPTKIVQSWRLDQWPKGHYSRLEINFDQNDVDNVTVMRVSWTGVPVGQEEVTKRNWKEYYIRSIKQTFG
jgi:activator of HSP90 ATPase